MKIIRWIATIVLILIMGYLSAIGLFADSSIGGMAVVILIFLAGSAGVGALNPERWQLSALCSFGAVLLSVLEIGATISRGGPVAGQQPMLQVVLIGLVAIALALLGGYIGYRLRTRNQ